MRLLAAIIAVVVVTAACSNPAAAATTVSTSDVGRLRLKTDRVVIFKDGYALFLKTAEGLADDKGRVYMTEIPEGAILGSFWAFSNGRPSLTMRAEWVDRIDRSTKKGSAYTVRELLRANRGKKVVLHDVRSGELAGTIIEVLETPADGETTPQGGELVVFQTDKGRMILPIADIRTITGDQLITELERKQTTTTREKQLTFELGAGARNEPVKINILYFTEGVRWIPTYRLSGDLDSRGELVLQGEILNEAEDIIDAAIDLVVGVPNFKMKHVPSPLALEQVMRNALAKAAPQIMNQMGSMSNAMFNARSGEYRNDDSMSISSAAHTLAPELASADAQQDLFVYHAARTSVTKGARLALPIFAEKIGLKHLYTTVLSADHEQDEAVNGMIENRVWHEVELSNPGETPWTTGPLLFVRGQIPLAQEMLGYTPRGGRTLLPVTIAPDVRVTKKVVELERAPAATSAKYTRVKKRVTVTVRNDRAQKIALVVTMSAEGKAEHASAKGHIDLLSTRTVNQRSLTRWEVELAPGESRELTVEVTTLVS